MSADRDKPAEKQFSSFLKDFFIGGISAGAVKSIVAPVERVKLLLQTQDANQQVLQKEVSRFMGIGDCFKRVYVEQGFLAFWRGNGANVIRYVPQQACNLAFKDRIKELLPTQKADVHFFRHLATNVASAGLGAALSLSFCFPLNLARTRLASDIGRNKRTFTGIWDCLSKTLQAQGVKGVYNGFSSGVVNVILYRGTQIGLFDSVSGLNPYNKERGVKGTASAFVIAQGSGILAVVVSYPPETVSRRMQMESERPLEKRIYKSALHCARSVLFAEGIAGLYKGVTADIVRGIGSSLVLVAYSRIKLVVT